MCVPPHLARVVFALRMDKLISGVYLTPKLITPSHFKEVLHQVSTDSHTVVELKPGLRYILTPTTHVTENNMVIHIRLLMSGTWVTTVPGSVS